MKISETPEYRLFTRPSGFPSMFSDPSDLDICVLCSGSIKALLRLCYGSVKVFLGILSDPSDRSFLVANNPLVC